MNRNDDRPSALAVLAWALSALVATGSEARAQTSPVSGEAKALQATVATALGTQTTTLGSTGALTDEGDAREASLPAASIPSVGGARVLHATAIGGIADWTPGEVVASEASVADLALGVGGRDIVAGFVMAQADAPVDAAATGRSMVEDLVVDGVPIAVTGAENQTISLPTLTLVLNEVQRTDGAITVNALRLTSHDGLVEVVVASATAGLR